MSVRGLNRVIVMGNLGTDPELRETSSTPVCSLSIATPGRVVDKEQTVEWVKVTTFGKTAELCAKYLKKGSNALIEGRMQTDKYTDKQGVTKYSTKVIGERVVFGPSGDKKQAKQSDESYDFDDYEPAF